MSSTNTDIGIFIFNWSHFEKWSKNAGSSNFLFTSDESLEQNDTTREGSGCIGAIGVRGLISMSFEFNDIYHGNCRRRQ